ncbi:phage terminase large subunit family protein [Methylophaga sp.]|uniref:phage terminase large subunit family protein n=1 Tax=Methylophaga sp. TaxID=2024840 RepID=UPI003A95AE9B
MTHSTNWQQACTVTMQAMMSRVRKRWLPPPKLTTTEWADKHRYLAAESSALPGKYNSRLTPWVKFMHEALDDPSVYKVVCMKSAQVAWTDGVINNWIGRIIDIDPSPIIGLFSKTDSAREFGQEKLAPMVQATPRLRDKLDVTTSKKDGNRALFKKFAGGFLKLVGSNSPSNVKSTPSPRVFVEEPDDTAINVGKQGDSIKLLEERTKTFPRRKVVFGGTPSVKGLSTIEDAYKGSDQRQFMVPCHDCGEAHALSWDNVGWDYDENELHEIYGHARPETAYYSCPHCGSIWSDHQKNRNVRSMYPEATAEFRGIAGFYINELYSPFPGSTFARLVERYLEAEKKLEEGDQTDSIVFTNSALGLPYEFKSDAPEADELREKALDYPELEVPRDGLLLTAGIDVQHNRFAVIIRSWGRDEESWLIYWNELHGNVHDKQDPVWGELEKLIYSPFKHFSGASIMMSAASLDSSDGTTSDNVYAFVRAMNKKYRTVTTMAVKGSSNDYGTREIFAKPKQSIDTKNKNNTKAAKYGLAPFIVGTHKAKDEVDRRLKLTGRGKDRFHTYKAVRVDYYDQVLAEVKAPHRSIRNKMVWQLRAGQRNEALDCEVYAMHAARAKKVHLMKASHWDAIEQKLIQSDLFSEPQAEQPKKAATPAKKQKPQEDDWI